MLYDKLGSISITGKIEYMAMGDSSNSQSVHASFQRSAVYSVVCPSHCTAQTNPWVDPPATSIPVYPQNTPAISEFLSGVCCFNSN